MACYFLAFSEILYGIIKRDKASIIAGILTLFVCDECCKSKANKCTSSQQVQESTQNQNSQSSESSGFGGIIV